MKPFAHQARVLSETQDLEWHAIFWEQGTGKTKLMLDNVAYLARKGEIDTVLVLAPNGVHRNWIEDEIPKHLGVVQSHFYEAKRAKTQWHKKACETMLRSPFCIIAMSYEGFMTKAGTDFARKLLKDRKCMMILDESTAIKTPGAKRTKRIVAAGKHALYRRILTGTPTTNSPFDLWSPFRFLDPTFWKRNEFETLTSFQTFFGIFEDGHNSQTGRDYKVVVGYRNLKKLKAIIDPHVSRVTKDEVLDLPPKLYSKRYFELTPEQLRVYKEIRDEAIAFLATGEMVTAPLAITRLLRLQQVLSNYTMVDEKLVPIGDSNPRLKCLKELLEEVSTQTIIWARFREDIDQIMKLLGSDAVRYDGSVGNDERAEAKKAFQAGEAKYFVANPAAGATGLTLTAARTVIYYSNSFSLEQRLQSEDRAHRIGQEHPVNYVDIMAHGTVDPYIVRSLRSKQDIARVLTGDKLREWI